MNILFFENDLAPEVSKYHFYVDGEFSEDLLNSYQKILKDELDGYSSRHEETQKDLENSAEKLAFNQLKCKCNDCLTSFRKKIRESVLEEAEQFIEAEKKQLEELIEFSKIDRVSDKISKIKRKLERMPSSSRFRLKRSGLRRLEKDLKSLFAQSFGRGSKIHKFYSEILKSKFNSILAEESLSIDLISDEQYERFFEQIHLGVWKNSSILFREFHTYKSSILSYKRKDISSNILNEYLGQFWVHSEARLKNRKIIYHLGPTNSGKTYHAIQALSKSSKGCYLAPLRLLAGELYDTLSDLGVKTTLLTGEEVIETEGASHYSSTIEMAKMNEEFDCCVIDEIQMIKDPQRGWAWTRALIGLNSNEVHICGDDSVLDLVKKILNLTGDTLEINRYQRMTELNVQHHPITLNQMNKNDALIVFSRRNALKYKSDLERLGHKVSIVYGRLNPDVRREQARKFDSGETDIIVSTDAIAMGMNLPVRRIVFSTLSKFFNSKEHPISDSEIKQIAGRAGRFQRFPTGYVTCLKRVDEGIDRIDEALEAKLDQSPFAMLGPDLDIFRKVNQALSENSLPSLSFSEFLRLFNTMSFSRPFYCVDLKEMIEVAEMVEGADRDLNTLNDSEIFGFSCAPVNLGMKEHVEYFMWILNRFVNGLEIYCDPISPDRDDIDYLETAIKCVELYQWLARHFQEKNFSFNINDLNANKLEAVEKLNQLLSKKIQRSCPSCGVRLSDDFKFNICEGCFSRKRFRPKRKFNYKSSGQKKSSKTSNKSKSYSKKRSS